MQKQIRLWSIAAWMVGAAILAACGGGGVQEGQACPAGSGSSASDCSPLPTASIISGIFTGTIVQNGVSTNALLIADANGTARVVQYEVAPIALITFGSSLTADDTSSTNSSGTVSAGFSAFSLDGAPLSNGANTESGTFTGNATLQSTITGSFTVAGASGGTASLSYSAARYVMPASFATVTGSYSFTYLSGTATETATITVNTAGNISGTDTSGCVYSGSLTIPNSAFNVYDVSFTSSCNSGGALAGVATYTAASGSIPASIQVLANNATSGLAITLNKVSVSPS